MLQTVKSHFLSQVSGFESVGLMEGYFVRRITLVVLATEHNPRTKFRRFWVMFVGVAVLAIYFGNSNFLLSSVNLPCKGRQNI